MNKNKIQDVLKQIKRIDISTKNKVVPFFYLPIDKFNT